MAIRNKQSNKPVNPANVTFIITLAQDTNNCKVPYNRDSLIESLTKLNKGGCFDEINISLYCNKSVIFGDPEKHGVMAVGFINGFNPETEEFVVTIYGRNVEVIEQSIADPVVFARVRASNNIVTFINGLDILDSSTYLGGAEE